jgi:hypothetical protein
MENDRDETVRKYAYQKWETEGRPEGQHERHWHEAEEAARQQESQLPKTSQPGEDGHVASTTRADGFIEDGEGGSTIEEPTMVSPGAVSKRKR